MFETPTNSNTVLSDENSVLDAVKRATQSTLLFLHLTIKDAEIPAAREDTWSRGFRELTSATHAAVTAAASSTELQEIEPEVRARLDAMLTAARDQVFEDGINNVVTDRLPDLVAKHFSTVVPAIAGLLEAGRISPAISAEILKELGRYDSPASHELRRWVLEHLLSHPAPIARDAAALGLARLADTRAIPRLRDAVKREPLAGLREDLQLVLDELSAHDGTTDADAATNRQ